MTISCEFMKCAGFKSGLDEQLFTQFPFQLFEFKDLPFIIENRKFHGVHCCNSNYRYVKNSISNEMNIECFNLKFNTKLNKICERAFNENKHLNHQYLNYNQLTSKLENYIEIINNQRLNSLNKELMIINYRNKLSLHKRFYNLIVQNDVQRLRQLLKVCFNNGDGIKTIINKFILAANDSYKPKGWCKDDSTFDLAFLVLRIGGPSLLHSFSQQNILPESSYIYKVKTISST